MAYKKPTPYTIRVKMTSGETFEHKFTAWNVALFIKDLRDKSFVQFGPRYLNRMNISYVHFPYQGLLTDGQEPLAYNTEKEWGKRYDEMSNFEKNYQFRDEKCDEFMEREDDVD